MEAAPAFAFDMSYCGPPPTLDSLWTRWNFDPVLILALVACAIAGALALRGASYGRKAGFAAALGLAAVLFISPICALTVALISGRVGHHIILTMVVAPLLALALPPGWGRRIGSLPALAVSTIMLWLWHAPDIYAAAFQHPAIYWTMQLTLLSCFTWLWLGLIRSENTLGAGVTALSSAIQMGLLGALLVFAPQALYAPHFATTLAFGLSPVEDQQVAGLIMWVPANLPLLALAIWRVATALQPDRESATR